MQVTQQRQKRIPNKTNPKKQQKNGYWDQIIQTVVRPPRIQYPIQQLTRSIVSLYGELYSRREVIVIHESKKIEVSIYDSQFKKNKLILYLHGNSSCRLESKGLIRYLPSGYSLGTFDFIGCGNNYEQDKITLGYNEAKQVQTVTNYLRCEHYEVILWGRSMGAVSALRYGKANVIVADSPFRDIRKLFKQMSNKHQRVPGCLINCLFPCVYWKLRKDVKQKARYDLSSLNTEKVVKQISPATTIIFITGNRDTLIDRYNSEKLFKVFPGTKKYLEVVDGNHNDRRPENIMVKIMSLIAQQCEKHDIIETDKHKTTCSQEGTENLNLFPQKQVVRHQQIQLGIVANDIHENK